MKQSVHQYGHHRRMWRELTKTRHVRPVRPPTTTLLLCAARPSMMIDVLVCARCKDALTTISLYARAGGGGGRGAHVRSQEMSQQKYLLLYHGAYLRTYQTIPALQKNQRGGVSFVLRETFHACTCVLFTMTTPTPIHCARIQYSRSPSKKRRRKCARTYAIIVCL